MKITVHEAFEKISGRFPEFKEEYNRCEKNASEIVLFGSYAYGCEHPKSDIDILFVGNKKRVLNKYFDFIWINNKVSKSRSWMCTELANHIARYGIWIKGNGSWQNKVFFSKSTINKKKQKIFERLLHIYLQNESITLEKKKYFIQKVILNTLRLKNIYNKIPNPPTCITVNEINDPLFIYHDMFKAHLLGEVGKIFFSEIFKGHNIYDVFCDSINDLKNTYSNLTS